MTDFAASTAVDRAVAVTTTFEAEHEDVIEPIWDEFAGLYQKRRVERGTRIAPNPFASVIENAQDWLWVPKHFNGTALVIGGEQYEAIFDARERARKAQRFGKWLFIAAAAMCILLAAGVHLGAALAMLVLALLALSQWWRLEGYLLDRYCARICARCPSFDMPPYYAAALRRAEEEALAAREHQRKAASRAWWPRYSSNPVKHD